MTERWERQVSEFRNVEAPTDRIWARVAEGPSRPLPPSNDRRRPGAALIGLALFTVVGMVVLLAMGLLSHSTNSAEAGGTEAVVSVRTPDQTGGGPEATLSNGHTTESAALDEYQWDGEGHAKPFPPKLSRYIPIARYAPLQVENGDEPDRTSAFLADPESFEGINGTEGVATQVTRSIFDAPPGRYVLVVQESWGCHFESPSATSCFSTGEGSQHQSLLTFYFGVRIVE